MHFPESHLARHSQLLLWELQKNLDLQTLREEFSVDKELSELLKAEKLGQNRDPDIMVMDGLVSKKGCLIIPSGSPFIPKLLKQFHTSVMGGHEGALKTFKRLCSEVY